MVGTARANRRLSASFRACISRRRARSSCLVSLDVFAPRGHGRYVPAHEENGVLVPLTRPLADFAKLVEPFDIIEGAQPPLRPLHLVVRETEFCGQRLAGEFRRRMRENSRNSVRRPRCASLTRRNYGGFCRPGNRPGLSGLDGGGRSPQEPVCGVEFCRNARLRLMFF